MDFNGNFRQNLDEKNRMRIPAKFREGLGDGFVMMKGPSGSISVLTAAEAKKFQDLLRGTSLLDPQGQLNANRITDAMYYPEVDEQGRFVLKNELKAFAKITKEIVVSGATERLSVWSVERYEIIFNDNDYDQVLSNVNDRIIANKAQDVALASISVKKGEDASNG
ncbi:MAG: hypothetical protein LBT30_08075 [Clostridiales bacterium]|jgi:MraZ protein|nr:hypothetical protein [Clostridiales bacterium]